MADNINKAKQRQRSSPRGKARFAINFMQGIKNKIRRMRTRLRRNPNDLKLADRLSWWEKEGKLTRKGTKWGV